MGITIARMAPVSTALRGCEKHLGRIADALEIILREAYGISSGEKPNTSGAEPEAFYTDDEKEFEREYLERLRGHKEDDEGDE